MELTQKQANLLKQNKIIKNKSVFITVCHNCEKMTVFRDWDLDMHKWFEDQDSYFSCCDCSKLFCSECIEVVGEDIYCYDCCPIISENSEENSD